MSCDIGEVTESLENETYNLCYLLVTDLLNTGKEHSSFRYALALVHRLLRCIKLSFENFVT